MNNLFFGIVMKDRVFSELFSFERRRRRKSVERYEETLISIIEKFTQDD